MKPTIVCAALALGLTSPAVAAPPAAEFPITRYGATADDERPDTEAIQRAIDACGAAGGGVVRVPKGRFLSGGLRLASNVRLVLDRDAVLQGSTNHLDYGKGGWNDALLVGENLNNVAIEGPGRIDGADCQNPKGEEGFRGPHAIRLAKCENIAIAGLTIERAGNYAVLCRDCAAATIEKVSFRGGHDGVHAQACGKFRVRECDFRTGDDCLAGCDNTHFEVVGCKINSSCNGFRLGCLGLLVKDCTFWGPGEHVHLVSRRSGGPGRINMLSAFVHFAPKDRNPKLPSDNWLIQNCTMDNVDTVYGYDIERGVWQTGQPAKRLRFEGVKATRVAQPLRVLGDAERQFDLTLENVSITLRDDRADREVLNIERFGRLTLRNVTLANGGKVPVLRARNGKAVSLDRVAAAPERDAPFALEQIGEIRQAAKPD
jgi:hypothetical protein